MCLTNALQKAIQKSGQAVSSSTAAVQRSQSILSIHPVQLTIAVFIKDVLDRGIRLDLTTALFIPNECGQEETKADQVRSFMKAT